MCHDIVDRDHAPLLHWLPRIRETLISLASGESPPAADLMRVAFIALADLIEAHLAKEENLLFPALTALSDAERAGRNRPPLPFATILHPIRMLEAEHLRIESALDQMHELAADVPPEEATPQWRRCMMELQQLDVTLRRHHQFENEVLFPAALDLERRVL
jgi:regulator of cell morphogenesis and NO signaling